MYVHHASRGKKDVSEFLVFGVADQLAGLHYNDIYWHKQDWASRGNCECDTAVFESSFMITVW